MQSEATNDLLARARAGDADALDALAARFLPRLKRWARGRLPPWFRDLADTDDLVQDALIRTLHRLPDFNPRGDAALEVYLRRVLANRLREEIRRARPTAARREELTDSMPSGAASPFEAAIDTGTRARYEAALETLDEPDRLAIVGRLELGYTFAELADVLGKRTPDAARKHTERAVALLARQMKPASG